MGVNRIGAERKEHPAISGLAAIIMLALFVWGVMDRYKLRTYVMEPFIAHHYHALLARQGLETFAGFWNLPWDWVEDPNKRRNGWSGVSRHTFSDERGGPLFDLREAAGESQLSFVASSAPWKTHIFSRSLQLAPHEANKCADSGAVFYGERQEGSKQQAVLATVALEGYSELNPLFQDPSLVTSVRQAILHRLAEVVQMIHRHHLQHNSLGGNHVMVKLEEDGTFDLRILDLEKTRHNFISMDIAVRELEKFIRHTPTLTTNEHAEFLLHYTRNFDHTQRRKLIKRINQRLHRKCLR